MIDYELAELARAREEYIAAMKSRKTSTLPADALLAIASIVRMAPQIPPSHEHGRPQLRVVR